ncbi:hypothetical protein [Sphingobium bisphenolivorans]|uniref:hypothetical protein n=1 Tax=Sphingobium bisphenolivorans TaxID=1335760 RepID=UPI000684D2FE|nr:hypothetical protein [Sphingobium bisphenolivorans]
MEPLLDRDDASRRFVIQAGLERVVEPGFDLVAHGLAAHFVRFHAVIHDDDVGAKPGYRAAYRHSLARAASGCLNLQRAIAPLADAGRREERLIPGALHDPAGVIGM